MVEEWLKLDGEIESINGLIPPEKYGFWTHSNQQEIDTFIPNNHPGAIEIRREITRSDSVIFPIEQSHEEDHDDQLLALPPPPEASYASSVESIEKTEEYPDEEILPLTNEPYYNGSCTVTDNSLQTETTVNEQVNETKPLWMEDVPQNVSNSLNNRDELIKSRLKTQNLKIDLDENQETSLVADNRVAEKLTTSSCVLRDNEENLRINENFDMEISESQTPKPENKELETMEDYPDEEVLPLANVPFTESIALLQKETNSDEKRAEMIPLWIKDVPQKNKKSSRVDKVSDNPIELKLFSPRSDIEEKQETSSVPDKKVAEKPNTKSKNEIDPRLNNILNRTKSRLQGDNDDELSSDESVDIEIGESQSPKVVSPPKPKSDELEDGEIEDDEMPSPESEEILRPKEMQFHQSPEHICDETIRSSAVGTLRAMPLPPSIGKVAIEPNEQKESASSKFSQKLLNEENLAARRPTVEEKEPELTMEEQAHLALFTDPESPPTPLPSVNSRTPPNRIFSEISNEEKEKSMEELRQQLTLQLHQSPRPTPEEGVKEVDLANSRRSTPALLHTPPLRQTPPPIGIFRARSQSPSKDRDNRSSLCPVGKSYVILPAESTPPLLKSPTTSRVEQRNVTVEEESKSQLIIKADPDKDPSIEAMSHSLDAKILLARIAEHSTAICSPETEIDYQSESDLERETAYCRSTKYVDLVKSTWYGRKGAKYEDKKTGDSFECTIKIKDQYEKASSLVSAEVARNIASFILLKKNDKIKEQSVVPSTVTPEPVKPTPAAKVKPKEHEFISTLFSHNMQFGDAECFFKYFMDDLGKVGQWEKQDGSESCF